MTKSSLTTDTVLNNDASISVIYMLGEMRVGEREEMIRVSREKDKRKNIIIQGVVLNIMPNIVK